MGSNCPGEGAEVYTASQSESVEVEIALVEAPFQSDEHYDS
jgi:hypothetical protein